MSRLMSAIADAVVTILVLIAGTVTGISAIHAFRQPDSLLLSRAFPAWLEPFAWFSASLIVLGVGAIRSLVLLRLLLRPAYPSIIGRIEEGVVELEEGVPIPDRRTFRSLGGKRGFFAPWIWRFAASSDESLAELLGALRDHGVVFEGINPAGWSPADVAAALRERGLVKGSFQQIVWDGTQHSVRSR